MATEKQMIAYDPSAFKSIARRSIPYNQYDIGYMDAASRIEDWLKANTVDAVEVVRCKNCLYYEETNGKDSGKPCGYGSCYCTSAIITGIVYDEDFCSYGERKDNGC